MNVEDNLDSDNFYDFWQLSGCAVVLCHILGFHLMILFYCLICQFPIKYLLLLWNRALDLL